MKVELEIKKIGNSFGVIIPKRIVKELGLEENEKVSLEIKRKTTKELFGLLREVKLNPEEAKKLTKSNEKW
jgi:antitoxin component of MazEF toxin-antitoxin module